MGNWTTGGWLAAIFVVAGAVGVLWYGWKMFRGRIKEDAKELKDDVEKRIDEIRKGGL